MADDILYTAGATKLIVVTVDKNIIQRYDIFSGRKELTVSLPITGVIKAIEMGMNSEGPLLIHWTKGISASDNAILDITN